MRGLIFGDHRNRSGRRGPVEPVAEAHLRLVFGQMVLRGDEAARWKHAGEGVIGGRAKVRVAIFGTHPPIVGDRIFETRVFEMVVLVPGTPVKNPVVSVMLVLKLVKAMPPVP
jgi:hypothetical protein